MAIYSLMPHRHKSNISADDTGIRSLRVLQRDIDSIFDNFFHGADGMPALKRDFLAPSLDITEDDRKFHVSMEVPGVDPDQVDISLSGGVLTIRGEKKAEEKKEGKNYHRVERSYGSFQRSLSLPDTIDTDKIEANFKNGVLEISLPKQEAKAPEVRKINVNK